MSTPTPTTPASEPLPLRVLRSIVALALTLALTVLVILVLAGSIPYLHATIGLFSDSESGVTKVALIVTVIVAVITPLIVMLVASRRRWLTWAFMGFAWLVVLPVLWWLSADDPAVRNPVTMEEFSPSFPGAEQSYALLMRYTRGSVDPEARAFAAQKLAVTGFYAQPADGSKWVDLVTKHRTSLDQDWAALAPQRHWIDQLSACERIGDLTSEDYTANQPSFEVWRIYAYHCCAAATLLALDGRGDEAIGVLIPLLDASRKLQPTSRTMLRSMIGEVGERMAVQTANLVLDRTTVSPGMRQRLAAALGPENAALAARRLVLADFVLYGPHYLNMRMGDSIAPHGTFLVRWPLNFFGSLFLNPNATMNLYGDHVRELAALAEARDIGKLKVRGQGFAQEFETRPAMKNVIGRLMIIISVPAFDNVIDRHWKITDARLALRQRLASPG